MVWMTTMAECGRGDHANCPGFQGGVQPGEYGGVICECACHVPAKRTSVSEQELSFWHAIKDSNDVSDLRLYLSHFPGGEFVDQARRKLAMLLEARPDDERGT